jgi:hypothetical protein
MGIRYDITYTVKELSRVLQQPTKTAKESLDRTLTYVTQTPDAYLEYNPTSMRAFTLPPTRKEPQFGDDIYNTHNYTIKDTIPQHDDVQITQTYKYTGPQMTITRYTDIDLAGQHETRQSTSGLTMYLNGALIHWHGQIISSTAANNNTTILRKRTPAILPVHRQPSSQAHSDPAHDERAQSQHRHPPPRRLSGLPGSKSNDDGS